MRTWVIEATVVAVILAAVAWLTKVDPAGWLCAAAVLLTFMHAQVSFRLSEAEDLRAALKREAQALSQQYEHAKDKPQLAEVQAADERYLIHVECHRLLGRYHVGKELLWLAYFVAIGSWPALVGVFVFLLYPAWRRFYLARKKRLEQAVAWNAQNPVSTDQKRT